MKNIVIITFLVFSLGCNQQKSYLESLSINDIDLHIKYQDSVFKVNNKYPNDLYSYYDKLIDENSDSASVYYFRGRIDSIKSSTFDFYKKSLEKDSSFFHVLISLALNSLEDGLNNEGIQFANKAKEKAPERQESYIILQNAYAALHDKSNNVSQQLKFTKLAIENTEIAYQLTKDEKYLEYLNQYTEIKNKEEYIIKYNNAVNQYNNALSSYSTSLSGYWESQDVSNFNLRIINGGINDNYFSEYDGVIYAGRSYGDKLYWKGNAKYFQVVDRSGQRALGGGGYVKGNILICDNGMRFIRVGY